MRVMLIDTQEGMHCVLSLEPEAGGGPWGEVTTDAAGALRLTIRPPAGDSTWELALEELAAALATASRLLRRAPPDDVAQRR